MKDDLIPSQESEDKAPSDAPCQQGENNFKQDVASVDNGERKETKPAIFFGAVEVFALVLWMLAEVFDKHDYWKFYVVFLSLAASCFLGGFAYLINKLWTGRPVLIWPLWGILSVSFAMLVTVLSRPPDNKSRNFVFKMRMEVVY